MFKKQGVVSSRTSFWWAGDEVIDRKSASSTLASNWSVVCAYGQHELDLSHPTGFWYLLNSAKTWPRILSVALGCMCANLFQPCLTLGDPMGCSPPGFSVHGSLQVRIVEWVAFPASRGSSWPRDWAQCLLCPLNWLGGGFFTTSASWKTPVSREEELKALDCV